MELVIGTFRVLRSVTTEAFNLVFPLFRSRERRQFKHSEWLSDSREALWTDSLIFIQKGLGFFLTSQSHQSTP